MLTKYYDRNDSLARNFFDPFYLLSDLTWPTVSNQTRAKTFYDVSSDDDGLTLTVDLPGVKKEDLNVETLDRTITIKSKRGSEDSSLSCRISKDYDIDSADASLDHGVLTLRFTKSKSTSSKTIQVK